MSKEQLEHFRTILQTWKRDLMVEVDRTVTHMKDEAANFPDPNDRATQEEEFSLELRTRDRERKLIRKIDEALEAHRGRQLRLLPRDRRGDRHQAPRGAAGGDAVDRGAGAPRAPREAVRRPGRPLPLIRRARAGSGGASRPRRPARLHLGSLLAAVGSYLDAARRGRRLAGAHRGPRPAARGARGGGRHPARLSRPSASSGTARSSTRAPARPPMPRRSGA